MDDQHISKQQACLGLFFEIQDEVEEGDQSDVIGLRGDIFDENECKDADSVAMGAALGHSQAN